jgi:hypothetical protein
MAACHFTRTGVFLQLHRLVCSAHIRIVTGF